MFVMYNGIGIQAERNSAIEADGHVVSYNTNQGLYATQNSHIIATSAGITTNGQQGALAIRNSGINITSSVIYDNNGSTAGVGNSSTKLQAVAANMSTINVNNINDTYLGAAALLPNKDTLGNSYSYISDSEGTLNT